MVIGGRLPLIGSRNSRPPYGARVDNCDPTQLLRTIDRQARHPAHRLSPRPVVQKALMDSLLAGPIDHLSIVRRVAEAQAEGRSLQPPFPTNV